jgi:UDP-N-acetylglucosamine transferase subunit ALG13
MILISVGTIDNPFHRLNEIVYSNTFFNSRIQKIIFQAGPSRFLKNINKKIIYKTIISNKKIISYIKSANIIISSGGEETMIDILRYSKNKPIIFPRLKKYKEHVDDQQLQIGKSLSKKKLAFLALNEKQLMNHIKKLPIANKSKNISKNNKKLIENLVSITEKLK